MCAHVRGCAREKAEERGHQAGGDMEEKAQSNMHSWCTENGSFYIECHLRSAQGLAQSRST